MRQSHRNLAVDKDATRRRIAAALGAGTYMAQTAAKGWSQPYATGQERIKDFNIAAGQSRWIAVPPVGFEPTLGPF